VIGKFLRYLHSGKLPYRAWTLYKSNRPSKNGGFVEVDFKYSGYSEIARYWRHTLKDLAEYVGGP